MLDALIIGRIEGTKRIRSKQKLCEKEKLSSIGNYLNRLYDYRKLPPLLRGFRCITVLVAALRKGCCKCKVDYRHVPF